MCNKCKFVSKPEVKEQKQQIINILNSIASDHKKEFGKGLNFSIVGSAKRNLVYQKGDSDWDIDFQLNINRTLLEEKLGDAHSIRNWFYDKLKQYAIGYKLENSTSVINAKLINSNGVIKSSFDLALISRNKTQTNILRFDKWEQKFIWNQLGHNSAGYLKYNKIKGNDLWKKLRGIYLDKKCANFDLDKKDQKSSSSILLESINETLQTY